MSTIAKKSAPAHRLAIGAAVVLTALTLAGCASGKWGFPYRAGIQQGNWITQEQVALLQPGMSREQVRFALGSPTLTDVLHADRWDYPYYFKPGYGEASERKFTVFFQNDQLVRWEGDAQPELQPFQVVEKDANKQQALDDRRERAASRQEPSIFQNDQIQTQIRPNISIGTERAPVGDAPPSPVSSPQSTGRENTSTSGSPAPILP